jgi:two-component system, chemotaxis family, sensor kinase CheA
MNRHQDNFMEEMADDFFAECDERLSHIKRDLLKLDELKGSSAPPAALIEELLRNLHTLKGLTGMIGAVDIMKLTHSLESYLKATYERQTYVPPEDLDVIFSGITMMGQLLHSFRLKSETPDFSGILARLEGIQPDTERDTSDKTLQYPIETSQEHAGIRKTWEFFFKPSRDLYEKGMNINIVRDRLTELGEIVSSRPRALDDGRIMFEFTVMTDKPEASFISWINDGITYRRAEDFTESQGAGIITGEHASVQKNVVRVELGRLDEMMRIVGDLVISRSRLSDHLKQEEKDSRKSESAELYEINLAVDRQLRDLREGIMKLRLVPVAEAFERLKFAVRDLIRNSGKSIRLHSEGEDTQIDKYVMEKMFDPLLHIVRNAVSHGIETPEERVMIGKPDEGKLILKASASGDSVLFEVSDDGRGIDREAIRLKAVQEGYIDQDSTVSDETLLEIITSPGFSTRETTDMISGRGVGMNVVMKTINELGGTLSFYSDINKGTSFVIRLPLTLSIVDALIVNVGKHIFAVPQPSVNEVLRFSRNDIIRMENNEIISYRDVVLPVLKLSMFFNLQDSPGPSYDAIVVGQNNEKAGILVDRITGQREIVVRSLPDPMVRVDGISGATELGEGRIVLILDTKSLVKSAMRMKHGAHT